jgi:electron transfer flavoprotein beta subunit
MNVLVCVKQILDPEIPARDFRINTKKREAERGAANLVIDTFSENALETALQVRDRAAGSKITVLSYGPSTAEEALRKALAMKADAAALVLSDGHSHPDPLTVAQVLAAAARKLGSFDLVMVGREAGDWGAGQTGGLLAELLGSRCVNFVDTIESTGNKLKLKRQTDSGTEIVEVEPPVVVTITNDEHNLPRIPKVRDTMMAHRAPLTKWKLEDLGIDAAAMRAGNAYFEVVELGIPKKEMRCEFVTGNSQEEKAETFAKLIADVASAI